MEPTLLRRLSLIATTATLLPLTFASCEDDDFTATDTPDEVVEGLPATVNLTLELTDMDVATRALIDDALSNDCASLWVGIYRASDDSCISNHIFTSVAAYTEVVRKKYQIRIPSITSKSGVSRVVAVANVNTCEAVQSPTSHEIMTLGNALTAADTWDKFASVCAMRSDPTDIYQLSYDLTMSGYYSTDSTDYNARSKEAIPTVDVLAGENNLTGVIKLRRLTSYNLFNISAGPNVTLDLESWQVCNNPYYSFVLPHDSVAGDINASDTVYNNGLTSPTFKLNTDGSYSFEFYQFENERKACDFKWLNEAHTDWVGIRDYTQVDGMTASEMYYDREREYKDYYSDANRTMQAEGGQYHQNTGIYKSLIKDRTVTPALDNNASYVVLKGKISYYINKTALDDPENAQPEAYTGMGDQILRTADVEYVIHLGYCEGKEKGTDAVTYATACDFNCRRNTRYTYNVTINGVNKIVVEAKKNGEEQSGAEGRVYDATTEYLTMDSHYNEFNIKLTNQDRNSLRYYIVAPYDGVNHAYDSRNYDAKWENDQFYTWVKFKPTSDSTVLAVYKTSVDDNSLWSLNDLTQVATHPNALGIEDGATDPTDEQERWYTVFIDEYVYHKDANGNAVESGSEYEGYDESTWRAYVDQEDRTVDFIVDTENSSDDNSIYMLCKYAFSQRAIQTYYSNSETVSAALGVEHTNESYGLNFRWNTAAGTYDDLYSTENGRQNLYKACQAQSFKWSNVILATEPEAIARDSNTQTNMVNKIPASTPPVMRLYDIKWKQGSFDPSPHSARNHYVNTACMNRNRDLNGDGVISTSEMRWYLPTYSQYTQIMIGLSGLVSPLIAWQEHLNTRYSSLPNYAWNNTNINTTKGRQNFHFAASDGTYLWADEGYSRGLTEFSNINDCSTMPYEIRCVRYLGRNPGTMPSDTSEVIPAYHRRGTTNIIDAPYYNHQSTRPYVSGNLASGDISSDVDRPYEHFEVSENICMDITDGIMTCSSSGTMSIVGMSWAEYPTIVDKWHQSLAINGICSQYTQEAEEADLGTWRVPNAKELAMMITLNMGLYGNMLSSTYEYFISFPNTNFEYCYFGRVGAVVARSVLKNYSNLGSARVRCVRDVK